MKEAECPKCVMSGLEPDGSCARCGGRWFKELPQKARQALATGPLKPKQGKLECPVCRKPMVSGGLVNELLRADFCGDCKGLWLDKAEIGLLERL